VDPRMASMAPSRFHQHSERLIADAGWHCTWCFRYLEDFQAKMSGYSHADRFSDPDYEDARFIQSLICTGTRPEGAYWIEVSRSWFEIVWHLRPLEARNSLQGAPAFLRLKQHLDRFQFLGSNCTRLHSRPPLPSP